MIGARLLSKGEQAWLAIVVRRKAPTFCQPECEGRTHKEPAAIIASPTQPTHLVPMKKYQQSLLAHLGNYAKQRLGIFEKGIYNDRPYAHILPSRLRFLNLLESFRSEIQDYLRKHRSIKLHRYFHHLNSSQALAFNVFYPYFEEGQSAARALSRALGFDARVISWEFEHIPDPIEGTNTDVMWRISNSACIYCEVKFSENRFGAAKIDDDHLKKLEKIYRPRLASLIPEYLLDEKVFFKNYQLLRNISLLAENDEHCLVIFLPRENEQLKAQMKGVLDSIEPKVRSRIKDIYLEDCLTSLQREKSIPEKLRVHAFNLAEKYMPSA